eukprot:TRINITY_DN1838_c0_g1_i1.p1 TRINITY_DN1838_c0_g1~~TRINITY_DN1838_c0_g1_i1.p1  ORF type:complete len:423 (-),score=114.93 TRINITY_DN1838_c0_g1_i1:411-1679(-)
MDNANIPEQIKEEVLKLIREELSSVLSNFRIDLLDIYGDVMREVKNDLQVDSREPQKRKRDDDVTEEESNKRPRYDSGNDSPRGKSDVDREGDLPGSRDGKQEDIDREDRDRDREDRRVVTDQYASTTEPADQKQDMRSIKTRDDELDNRGNNESYNYDMEDNRERNDLTPRSNNYRDESRNIDNRFDNRNNMNRDVDQNQPPQHRPYYDDNNNNGSNGNTNNNGSNNGGPNNNRGYINNRHIDNNQHHNHNPHHNNQHHNHPNHGYSHGHPRGGHMYNRGGGPNNYYGDKRGGPQSITTRNTIRMEFKRDGMGRGGGGMGGGGQGAPQAMQNMAPMGTIGERYRGVIRELKPHKGYGKVQCNELSQEWIWFSFSQLKMDLKDVNLGDNVEFELGNNGVAHCANAIRRTNMPPNIGGPMRSY